MIEIFCDKYLLCHNLPSADTVRCMEIHHSIYNVPIFNQFFFKSDSKNPKWLHNCTLYCSMYYCRISINIDQSYWRVMQRYNVYLQQYNQFFYGRRGVVVSYHYFDLYYQILKVVYYESKFVGSKLYLIKILVNEIIKFSSYLI